MSDFVKDDKGLSRPVQRLPVPIERAPSPLRMDRHAEAVCERQRREAMPLRLGAGGAIRRGSPDQPKHSAMERFAEAGHESVERVRELLSRYRGQDHLIGQKISVGAVDGFAR
jgi:hypothetical protein